LIHFYKRILQLTTMSKSELLVLARATQHVRRQKAKEERKKVLRLCVNKLQNIQDPELYLCKSVLINNTLRNIQLQHREAHRKAKMKREREEKLNEEEYEVKKKCLSVEVVDEAAGAYGEEIVVDHESNPLSSSYYDVNSYKTDTLEDVIMDNKDDMVVTHRDIEYTRHFWQGEGLDLSKSTLDISVISAGVDDNAETVNDTPEDALSDNSSDDTLTSDSSVDDSSCSDSDLSPPQSQIELQFSPPPHPYEVSTHYTHFAVGIPS